jgi:hypothetical protein
VEIRGKMSICEFCLHSSADGTCRLGLSTPKRMSCREFDPGMEKFCADRTDFVNPNQIIQMATFFGFQRTELKKVKVMADREASLR